MPNILDQDAIDKLMNVMEYKSPVITQDAYDDIMSETSILIPVYRQILITDIDKQLKSKVNMTSAGYDILLSITRTLTENYETAMAEAIERKS